MICSCSHRLPGLGKPPPPHAWSSSTQPPRAAAPAELFGLWPRLCAAAALRPGCHPTPQAHQVFGLPGFLPGVLHLTRRRQSPPVLPSPSLCPLPALIPGAHHSRPYIRDIHVLASPQDCLSEWLRSPGCWLRGYRGKPGVSPGLPRVYQVPGTLFPAPLHPTPTPQTLMSVGTTGRQKSE